MQKILNKLLLALGSRTVWIIVMMFLVNGIQAIRSLLPPYWIPIADAILSLSAIYFHVNPSQTY